MNICFETFGCRLNRAEALEDEANYLAEGHQSVKEHSKADLIVVRGCSVTARAQRDCERLIAHLRKKYPTKRIIVRGCLPGAEKGKPGNAIPTSTSRAYLKVQNGCAGNCTFCIVPKFRGASVSEPFGEVVAKATRFIEAGYHEIVVTGCNLALYASEGKRLPELLDALAALSPDCRIRLGSLEPWGCAEEVVDVLRSRSNICRFLHLPVQSGSDRILKLMNRPYRAADVERIVRQAQKVMPLIALGCDLMTGFPSETDRDFGATRQLLTTLPFSSAHIFPFSERPGTPAATMTGSIPNRVRSSRAHVLSRIVHASRQRFVRQFIGKQVEIINEYRLLRKAGWTSEHLWLEGPSTSPLHAFKESQRKQLMRFLVVSAKDDILHGTPVTHGR